ncbi:hypothetical protein RI129_012336 [Pyrocoelia pectoralis]|uniref:FYVE-type domain-containing protein n=1 Tax=Pyrocoelia pectoralis TaxID=417401 RepID=A0AAN7V3L3_9COLE
MDKYTVDLDKVLNDFEYSELTDQYNTSNNAATPQRNQDLYKYNVAPPKHNITKVFESLNEYLNSEIGDEPAETSVSENICENSTNNNPTSVETDEVGDESHQINESNTDTAELEEINDQLQETNIADVEFETVEQVEDVNPRAPVVGFDTVIDDSNLSEYLDELETEEVLEEDVSTSSTTNQSTNEVEDNLLPRPSSLPVNSSAVQIDLVGEPGSTPYNNVYVSHTLTKPTESDADSSPTPSPTFSEVSTESNGSTATTESVTDVPSDKNAQRYEPHEMHEVLETSVANTELVEKNVAKELSAQVDIDGAQSLNVDLLDNLLGKQAPVWIPDSDTLNCLHCDTKFTVIKRRHHCRACGLVLCAKCSNKKYKLEYLNEEARVCVKCYDLLNKDTNSSSGSEGLSSTNSPNHQSVTPNPNNPMEYCSMVPPLQQINASNQNPPTVMVPVGVLKRKGSTKLRTNKSVIFCDGIRPGSELTNLDNNFDYNEKLVKYPKENKNDFLDSTTKSFIPHKDDDLPPIVNIYKADISYTPFDSSIHTMEFLKKEKLVMAIHSNLYVHIKIINMDCCINKWAWCFSTEGMINVGQDEILILLEYIDNEKSIPKDVFFHLNSIYNNAKTGSSITEYGISLHDTNYFLDSKNHVGFLFIRQTFQCLQNVIIPNEMYLIGILIHRWEMPWAKIFPLRLILRLGAEYRYYPCPIVSTRHRESVFVEIGHTIINLLADFRNFSYTLPYIRGLTIHMEDKNTTVTIPLNRYDQVIKSLNNSSDHILAFGGNFSTKADSHLVCIQDTQGNNENTYTTHAINIHNRPRKITGASFIVFNGALKSSSGLIAKSSIVEDGLMIQIPPEHMVQIRENLRNMKNHTIQCGCINVISDETINVIWGENDISFNLGVQSSIDNQSLTAVPSIRVHNGKDFICNSGNRLIRWTEVFILQGGNENGRGVDIDFSKLAESISRATCQALVKYLDLLLSNNFYKIGIRTNLHVENVSYSAGSNGMKLPPIYMKSLDNELIPVLHKITSNNVGDSSVILELVFRILNV